MNNLNIYNQVRAVPKEALREIQAGRLKGKSDINPMWRIKALTERFGPCGIGWKYAITNQWLEKGGKDEIAAFVNIDLFIKNDGAWSDPIPGTGGSSFVANEKNGPYTSDECFKMALTDAISVSCKALGFGADVYWEKDSTKYNKPPQEPPKAVTPPKEPPVNWLKYNQALAKIDCTIEDALHLAKEPDISHYTYSQAMDLYKKLQIQKAKSEISAGEEFNPDDVP